MTTFRQAAASGPPSSAGRSGSATARSRRRWTGGGSPPRGCIAFGEWTASSTAELDPEDTSRDDAAFWLYSSGTTGRPKAAVHLHHDMIVAADLYARPILGIGPGDICFSVAKLF